jgi:hypothetical protein
MRPPRAYQGPIHQGGKIISKSFLRPRLFAIRRSGEKLVSYISFFFFFSLFFFFELECVDLVALTSPCQYNPDGSEIRPRWPKRKDPENKYTRTESAESETPRLPRDEAASSRFASAPGSQVIPEHLQEPSDSPFGRIAPHTPSEMSALRVPRPGNPVAKTLECASTRDNAVPMQETSTAGTQPIRRSDRV